MIPRDDPEYILKLEQVESAKFKAQVLTLREWYDSTPNHCDEINSYIGTDRKRA